MAFIFTQPENSKGKKLIDESSLRDTWMLPAMIRIAGQEILFLEKFCPYKHFDSPILKANIGQKMFHFFIQPAAVEDEAAAQKLSMDPHHGSS